MVHSQQVSFSSQLSTLVFIALLSFFSIAVVAQGSTKSHVSSDKIFIVTYPDDWKVNKAEQENAEFCVNAPGANMFKPCMVKMQVNKKAQGYEDFDIRQLSEVELKMLKAQPDQNMNLEVLESNFKTIGDHEWWMMKGKMTQKKAVYYTNSYKTIHNNKIYIFTYFSNEKNFEPNAQAAQKIFESIEFLTKNEVKAKAKSK